MKPRWICVCAVAFVLTFASSAWSATVTWDGGGGDFSWQTPANWSGDTLPGTNDTAIINIGGSATVTSSVNVTILNLQCSNHLTLSGGTFLVQSGSSVLQGQLSASGGAKLSASGSGTKLTVIGTASANTGQFEASAGATISIPNLTSYSAGFVCFNVVWLATGSGSVLDFSGVTNLTGDSCATLNVQALSGGSVLLTNLAKITDGNLYVLADGTGSLINLPVLAEATNAVRDVTLEARNSGTVSVPQLKRGPTLAVAIKSGGTLPVAQMEILNGITVDGLTVSFPALTNFNAGSIDLSGGAVVSLPNLKSYSKGSSCGVAAWNVSGSNSVLNLSALTNLLGGTCTFLNILAASGGTVSLTNIVSVPEGNLSFVADGTNSLVNLTRLQNSPGTRTVAFEARNSGTMSVPLLSGGANVTVALKSGGILPVAQMNPLAGITVDGMTVDFPALTLFDTGSFSLNNGAVVSVPNLANYNKGSSCGVSSWIVSGSNSVLKLPALTNLNGGNCTVLNVQALTGGSVILTNVIAVSEGYLSFLADGVNSLINFSRLQNSHGTLRSVAFEVRNAGTISIPLLPGGANVTVTLKSGGIMPVAQMKQLVGITVDAMTVDFPLLIAFDTGSFSLSGGAAVSVPILTNYNKGASCGVSSWIVSGSNSVLKLPALTNMTGGNCTVLNVQALTGGTVILSNVVVVSEGYLSFLADGTNSLINLSRLQNSLGTLRFIAFEARNAGTILLPLLVGGATVDVTLVSGGVMSVAQMRQLNGITIGGMAVSFPGLTNLDMGNLTITNGANVSISNLVTYAKGTGCVTESWVVRGAGSVLNLPALTTVTGGDCAPLNLQAFSGGQLVLSNLSKIPGGFVALLADGASSLLELHSLSNFVTRYTLSELRTTNNGSILLNDQGLIFSGVAIKTLAGSGVPTAFHITNSTQTMLYGKPWHSYWVDQRNTTSPANPWGFFRRVPLTNNFQTIGPLAAANTEFRVFEFVADPFALELTPVAGGVDMVLYGPTNHTFEVWTTTNLATGFPWPVTYTVAMTNTFRILPREPLATPQRFFKVNPL